LEASIFYPDFAEDLITLHKRCGGVVRLWMLPINSQNGVGIMESSIKISRDSPIAELSRGCEHFG
jgi:hypothetical protein